MANNFYVVVREKTGKLFITGERLPFFWLKKNAQYEANRLIGCTVKPVPAKEFENFLTNIQKK
jgi:hypothetical protein